MNPICVVYDDWVTKVIDDVPAVRIIPIPNTPNHLGNHEFVLPIIGKLGLIVRVGESWRNPRKPNRLASRVAERDHSTWVNHYRIGGFKETRVGDAAGL